MRKTIVLLVIAILLISSFPAIVFAAQPDNLAPASDFSSENILVKFKPGVTLPEAAEIHRQLGGQAKETIPGIGVQVVTVPKGRAMAMAKAYSSNARVAYAEPDFVVQAADTPDDPYFGKQYGLTKVEAPQAWEVTTGSPGINIAILDTGVDQDHPDLAAKIVNNINFTSSPTVDDAHGHGTHVAGIAAAMTDNGIGVAGLGYSSTIMNVKVLGDGGMGTDGGVALGIIWAADNGAEIISMSLGGTYYSSTLEDAVNYAWSKGVVVVAAAGNNGNTIPFYPAACTNCIAVAATNAIDAKASGSNYGDWVDMAAPGIGIYATFKDSSYGYGSGTSMASPHVAGLAALVFTTVSDANGDGNLNDEVRSRIEATCDDIGVSGIGHGRINAARAVGDVAPVPPGSISGQVSDAEDGAPIAVATVSDGTKTATTDAAGEYTITDVPLGTYEVTASKSGYQTSSLTVTVASEDDAVADFSLNEVIVPGSIAGTVADAANGSSIVGATVSDGTRTATTDAAGEYTITDVPPGSYEVTASKAGYQSSSLTVDVLSGTTAVADFSLDEVIVPGSITGSVTDAEDGSPIVGAMVTDGVRTATTDAAGEYTIADVPPGSYEVTASKAGYQGSSSTVTVLSGGTAVANFSLHEVIVPGSITGSVTDAEDGAPIFGATVSDGIRTTTTDATGEYTIADVPPGTYEVTASKAGYENSTSTVTVVSGGTAVKSFSLDEVILPGSITGSVTDVEGGSPIVGAMVTDGTRTATTDGSGEYTIADVPPGTYEVTASKEGYESITSSVTVASGATLEMNFSLNQKSPADDAMWVDAIIFTMRGVNLFVEVRIMTASGDLPGAEVGLGLECSNGDAWSYGGTTDTNGMVKFKLGKAPAGSYWAGLTSLTCSGFTWDANKGVTAASYILSG
jgi:thermitase